MVQKLKHRYFMANMTLLSCTLLIALTVLFVLLYRAEVQSSYDVMNDLLAQAEPLTQNHEVVSPMVQSAEQDSSSDFYEALVLTSVEHTEATAITTTTQITTKTSCHLFCHDRDYRYEFPPYWSFGDDDLKNDNEEDREDEYEDDGDSEWQDWWEQQPPPPPPPPAFSETTTSADAGWLTTTTTTRLIPPGSESHVSTTERIPSQHSTEADLPDIDVTDSVTAVHTTAPSLSSKTQITVSGDGVYVPDAFVAEVLPDGQISSYAGTIEDTSADEDFHTVHSAVSEIRKKGGESGTIKIDDTSYRYMLQPTHSGGYQMVLLSRSLELSMLSRMLILFVALAVFGLVCMFGISVLLANWTVRPIALAWEKQKQFVADASHELKTPLAVISANTEVILANPYDTVTDQSKWLNYIKAETMRMSKLITNLLTVARMDHTKEAEHAASLNFHELVANVCLVFEPIIYENGKTLNTVLQRNVMLRGDEDNLKQLLSILLDNAVLHSTPGADITVTLSKDVQGKIRLAVANTAKDIPLEELSHLFDRFYRLDTVGSPNGSGLGLSIARSIVRDMNGSLTVHSENNVVTFVATFPNG